MVDVRVHYSKLHYSKIQNTLQNLKVSQDEHKKSGSYHPPVVQETLKLQWKNNWRIYIDNPQISPETKKLILKEPDYFEIIDDPTQKPTVNFEKIQFSGTHYKIVKSGYNRVWAT